jgi:hypothetical protein
MAHVLELHRDLYPEAAVRQALAAFAARAAMALDAEGPYHRVSFEMADASAAARLKGELANYVLGLTVHGGFDDGSSTS